MKCALLTFLIFFARQTPVWAHGAHVHGAGNLAIAFDAHQGQVEFHSPAESILGFEHPAKSSKDKKALQQAEDQFVSGISQMIQMDPSLKCQFAKDKVTLQSDEDGDHVDFIVHFKVHCEKTPLGSTLKVDFSSWKRLHKLDVTVLIADLQKTAQATSQPVQIELKP